MHISFRVRLCVLYCPLWGLLFSFLIGSRLHAFVKWDTVRDSGFPVFFLSLSFLGLSLLVHVFGREFLLVCSSHPRGLFLGWSRVMYACGLVCLVLLATDCSYLFHCMGVFVGVAFFPPLNIVTFFALFIVSYQCLP